MMGQLVALQEHVASLAQRLQTFENWETEGQETYEIEDELVPGAHGDSPPVITFTADQPRLASPLLRNLGSSPRRLPPQHSPIVGRVVQDGNEDDDAQSTQGVEECFEVERCVQFEDASIA